MSSSPPVSSHMERLWDLGQQHLAGGRYVSARRHLEAAESMAWRAADARSLARLYLSLLEARRQIRQHAVEGPISIGDCRQWRPDYQQLKVFLFLPAGTFLFADHNPSRTAGAVPYASRRQHSCIEALVLMEHKRETRVATMADMTFAAGLPVRFTSDPADLIKPAPSGEMVVPLPPAGVYDPDDALHGLARESLLVAWEGLALKWQARHPMRGEAWEEMAWLRLALRIDPACEPAAMRVIALAEEIGRMRNAE